MWWFFGKYIILIFEIKLQAEREKKRLEREAKQAEKEARRLERLQKKEEKEKLKEQKAKEREEKRLARLALQESMFIILYELSYYFLSLLINK